MKIAALIIHFEREDLTNKVVEQLDGLLPIYVIDNGSKTKFYNDSAISIRLSYNRGFIGGVNDGMLIVSGYKCRQPSYDYIWCLNNDITGLNGNLLNHLTACLDAKPHLAAVSPAIYNNPHGHMRPSEGGFSTTKHIDWVAPLVRVSAWKDIGGFDEELKGYGCDQIFCYEGRRRGWEFGVIRNLSINHQMGASVSLPGAYAGHSDLQYMNDYICKKYNLKHWTELNK